MFILYYDRHKSFILLIFERLMSVIDLEVKYSIEKNVNTVNLNASCAYLCMPVYLHQYIGFT